MDRNNETIRLAKKAADAWRTTDTYHQAAQIIDMLISALEGDTTLTPPNEPLTLEELREMKGQPVWTVTTGLDGSGRWELVCDVDYEDVLEMASCVDGFYAIEMDTYGSTWTAYRRPPEGEV